MEDVIFNMLKEAQNNSTNLDNVDSSNLVLKRDEKGNLCSYDKTTGEKVGYIDEHGNSNVSKTFGEMMERRGYEE